MFNLFKRILSYQKQEIMRKLFIGFLLVLTGFTLPAQQYFGTEADDGHRCILLMNPTARNLQTFIYLTDQQIFPLPADYHIVGFYQKDQAYDFHQSLDFIKKSGRNDLFLQVCEDAPGVMLFGENQCSDDFINAFSGSAGIIFFGGPDIPPSIYGEATHLLTEITDYHRHAFEASFLFHLLGGSQNEDYKPLLDLKPDYRILGICLGMQTMNIATGGTLVQDIPSQLYNQQTIEQILAADPDARHRNYNTNFGRNEELLWGDFHRIKLSSTFEQTWLDTSIAATPYVLSSHHQALARMGKGWEITATSMDGKIVEAMRHKSYPNVLGIQFHPEPTFLYQPENKLKLLPGQTATASFIDLYGGARGENFNRNIWGWMGEIYR